jgi:SusD family.
MINILKKGVVLATSLLLLGTFFSCKNTSLLDEVVYSELTEDNAFSTKADAVAAVNGIYAPISGFSNSAIFSLNDLTTDDCFMKETDCELLNETKMSSNGDVSNLWTSLWKMVGRANIAIDKIPGIALSQFGTDEAVATVLKNRLLAEAYFLRGFAYYNLTDLFYKVPLVTSSGLATNAILPLATMSELETQIDSDLTAAMDGLPQTYSSTSDAGRATYGAAAGYLCRLHMRKAGRLRIAGKDAKSEWTTAQTYADMFITGDLKDVYHLQSTVWKIFDPTNDASLYNDEIIFADRSNANSVNGTSDIGMRFTPWSYDCGWNIFSVPLQLAWKFDKSDQRYSTLLVTEFPDVYDSRKTYVIPPTVDKSGSMATSNAPYYQYELSAAYTKKYMYTKALTYNYNTGNNMNYLRLADIILCKAEILNELNGPTQAAIDLINRIRERAFQNSNHNLKLSDYATTADLRSAICDERLFELNTEAVRRPDLIRMGLWKNRMDKYVAEKKVYADYYSLHNGNNDYSSLWKVYPDDLTESDIRRYFPAPKTEQILNPALANCRDFSEE